METFLSILIAAVWLNIQFPLATGDSSPSPVIYIAKCNGNSYTVVKNRVYDGSKVLYRIPPGTKYHLQGCTLYYGDEPAYNITTNKRYIGSYPKKRKIPQRILYVENGKLIKVREGRIYIGKFRAYEDDDLKRGKAHIYQKDGNLYINSHVVMKKNPYQPKIKIPDIVNLNLKDANEFQIKMKKSHILQYNDKRGREQIFMNIVHSK